jgi:myo-inositol 2-dehydrogenase/D-chiro-inositol 1-dehydrogenase
VPAMNDRLGVVVAGCGAIGQAHFGSVVALPEARLVASVDVDEDRAREYAQRYRAETSATSLEPLLEREDVDAVIVATTNATHAPLTIAALEAGKHVLVQKPMCMNLTEADEMVAAADRSPALLMVSFFELYHPAFMRAKAIVDAGLIGDVFLIKAMMAWGARPVSWGGPPGSPGWRANPEVSGGGIFMDGPPHHVALYKWLLGDPPVENVWAEMMTVTPGGEVEDAGVIVVRTEKTIVELTGSTCVLEPNQPMNRHFKEWVEIYGTGGTIHIHPTERPSLQVYRAEQEPDPLLGGGWIAPKLESIPYPERVRSVHFNPDEDPWVGEHRHFFACIREGKPPLTDGRFGRDTMAVIMAAYESARERRAVAPGALA